ncbi:hypothetical protein [Zavarzinella formosa]|uniref:hypothetical protein n=1 Tax=Zavarzinella formosa TaxID=360055 RepID=UPI000304F56F|nr:hypothetical protein [Zavarzinella formosa]
MDKLCLKMLAVMFTGMFLMAIQQPEHQYDQAGMEALVASVQDETVPVVLWKAVPACEQDDWGCTLGEAYYAGYRPQKGNKS